MTHSFPTRLFSDPLTDAAVVGGSAAAAPDDAREFVAERGQLSNLRLDLPQMRGRDAVGLAAVARRIVRQVEQRADFLDRETQLARMAHEAEPRRSEEHTSELQSLMRISYAVFCLKKKNNIYKQQK